MGIGVSVFLIALGAILSWGVNVAVPHANLFLIGLILIGVGVLGLITSLVMWGPRRRATTVAATPYTEERVVHDPVRREVYRDVY